MNKLILISLLALSVFLLGCTGTSTEKTVGGSATADIEGECVSLCQLELQRGTDLSNGPCISNSLKVNSDWVCDVAHEPRESADDLQENQCSAFREGKATHFVEVNESCRVIKKY
ncbi:MAG: hypothetical protein ABIE23_01330 [archaeon]|nr:hypothetical protein [Candidatus Micrarchaeota archaeon]